MLLIMILLISALSGCSGIGTSAVPDAGTAQTPAEISETAEAASAFDAGSGTAEDPWQIATAEQLDLIRNDLIAHYVLIGDIDLSG